MRQFITKISLFFLAILICMIGLSVIHISDEFVIDTTHETSYKKLAWDITQFHNPEKLNDAHVFIGPSLIRGDINDSILCAKGIKSVNMGINRNGFDLDHYITHRVLETSRPQKIYMYRPREEGTLLHPMMPMLLSPFEYYDMFKQFPIVYIRKYVPKRIYFVIDYLLYSVFPGQSGFVPSAYGFRGEENQSLTSEDYELFTVENELSLREQFAQRAMDPANASETEYAEEEIRYYYQGASEPMRSLSMDMIKNAGIDVSEIYLPIYTDALIADKTDKKVYFKMPRGYNYPCMSMNDYSFLNDPNLWFDLHHLNSNGAKMFTDSLVVQLKEQQN